MNIDTTFFEHLATVQKAQQALFRFLLDEFRPGVIVYFRHNGHAQKGIVIYVAGTALSPCLLVVNSKTHKRRRVYLEDIYCIKAAQEDGGVVLCSGCDQAIEPPYGATVQMPNRVKLYLCPACAEERGE